MRSSRNLLLPAAVVPLIVLAGCGSGGSSGDASPSASSSSTSKAAPVKSGSMDDLSLKQEPKKAPVVSLKKKPFSIDKTTAKVVSEGKGKAVTKAETLTVDYAIVNGTDGKQIEGNFGKPPVSMDLASKGMLPGLVKGLQGKKIGSKVLVAVPPADAFGKQGNTQAGIKGTDTLLFYVDIKKASTPLKSAEGTTVPPKKGLPTVTFNKDKPAKITMPKSAAPKKLVVQPLIKGKGAKVEKGQTVKVNYTGALWKSGKVFDSSMGKEPFAFQVGAKQVIPGWDKALQGQPVGSRLLVIVPPDEGYGKKANQSIPANSTLTFVVDILAAT